jgi:tetratricopeptide (TPR) repeat protein
MRVIPLVFLMILAAVAPVLAQADNVADCAQAARPDIGVIGCTAMITSGRAAGAELAAAYNNRGLAYRDLNKNRLAIKDFSGAIILDPKAADLRSNRGVAYAALGEYQLAIADYDDAIRMDPNYAGAYANRGNTYVDLEKYALAITDYDRAVNLAPNDARVFYGRAIAFSLTGDHDSALQDYDRAISLASDFTDAYNNRGSTRAGLEQYEGAVQDFKKVIALDPNDRFAIENLGKAYAKLAWSQYLANDLPGTLRNIESAIAADTRFAVHFDDYGHVLAAVGRSENAVDAFERAVQIGGSAYAKLYQQALRRHGYYRGTIDGSFGRPVLRALRRCIDKRCRLVK